MRALVLLVLSAGLMVGCSSSNNGRYDRSGRATPASSRAGSADRPYVCHNGNTIAVSRNAVRAHRRHGDRIGACTRRDQRDRRAERRDDRRDHRERRRERRQDRREHEREHERDHDRKHDGRHDRDH